MKINPGNKNITNNKKRGIFKIIMESFAVTSAETLAITESNEENLKTMEMNFWRR